MSVPEVEIVLAIGSDNVEIKQQCLDVRIKVFIDEQGFSMDDEIDAYDSKPDTAHILLRLVDNKTPVGTIRCARIGETEFKLSRLAVLDEYRKFKFGQKLVLALADYAKAKAKAENLSSCSVICHSQIPVIPFYEKYGYTRQGEEFDEDGAPHLKLVAQISLE